jgi:cytoskeleton protein RodZ
MTTMSSERGDEPMTPDHQHDIPGKVLAAHREAMGWTVEQVADQLKLAVRQVIALEAGDYAALPSPAVTRGFVRAYAKLMKLDPAPLVARIEIESETPAEANPAAMRRPAPASFSQTKFPSHGKKRSSLPLALIGAAVVLAAAGAAAWHFGVIPIRQHAETAAPAAAAPAGGASPEAANGNSTETLQNPAVPLISVPGPNGNTPAPAAEGSPNAPANPPANGAVVNVPSTTATGAPPTAVPAAPASPAAVQTKASAPTLAPGAPAPGAAASAAGANALVITVREDSWIDVRPAKGGAPLISRLVTAGSTETIAVDQPVKVVVGNPGGVNATLRGAAVALPVVPGKKISRLNLQ